MERSENIGDLAGALAKAQGAIKGAAKGKENPFYKSSYADLACVMDACRDALSKNSIAVIQSTQYDATDKWVETVLAHSSGQWISSRYPVKPVKDDPQGLGSAVTYARRYSLMALVGIVAEDEDDDGNAASGKTSGNPQIDPRPPLERPKQSANGNGNGTHKDDKAAALKWVNTSVDLIGRLGKRHDIELWEDKNKDTMTKLKALDIDLFDRVTDAIVTRFAALSTLNAG